MEFKNFFGSWQGAKLENRAHRVVNIALTLTVVILAIMAASRDQIVIMQPPEITQEVWMQTNKMDPILHEKWSYFFAMLLGNVHPKNADYVRKAIGSHLDASIYRTAMDELFMAVEAIKKDNMAISFKPQKYLYEEITGRTFVSGLYEISGVAGKHETYQRTYEFLFNVNNYNVTIDHMESYRGLPRTTQWWEDENKKKEAERRSQLAANKGGAK